MGVVSSSRNCLSRPQTRSHLVTTTSKRIFTVSLLGTRPFCFSRQTALSRISFPIQCTMPLIGVHALTSSMVPKMALSMALALIPRKGRRLMEPCRTAHQCHGDRVLRRCLVLGMPFFCQRAGGTMCMLSITSRFRFLSGSHRARCLHSSRLPGANLVRLWRRVPFGCAWLKRRRDLLAMLLGHSTCAPFFAVSVGCVPTHTNAN